MRELDPAVEERNYSKVPLTKKEIGEILKAVSVADVLNTRHKVAKAKGWKEKAPSKTVFVQAAVEENNLLRRPILLSGGEAVVGKSEAAIRELLA